MMSFTKSAKPMKPVKDSKPKTDSDPYARLLNTKVEALLSNGSKLSGVLVEVSPYAIMLENVEGVFVINKAYLIQVARLR
jgi:small nuclear ribonucleoprotein (snRNP)-like protein